MKKLIAAAGVGFTLAALAVLLWNGLRGGNSGDSVAANKEIERAITYIHHPPLAEGEHPSVWLDDYPVVALVTVESVGKASWNTDSGGFEGPELGISIYTPVQVDVDEYIKGSGEEALTVQVRGGVADGITMDLEIPIEQGTLGVLFLNKASKLDGALIVNNAYIFDGDTAYSNIDQKSIAVDDLLSGLRDAAPASN